MPSLFKHAQSIYDRDGFTRLLLAGLGFVYNRTIWPILPESDQYKRFNGVKVRKKKVFDSQLPFPT
ncbi:MAG: hypothetical protein ABEI86_02770, partial [Halobacteriaceae archaeon]